LLAASAPLLRHVWHLWPQGKDGDVLNCATNTQLEDLKIFEICYALLAGTCCLAVLADGKSLSLVVPYVQSWWQTNPLPCR
jgi:hypothetical protein